MTGLRLPESALSGYAMYMALSQESTCNDPELREQLAVAIANLQAGGIVERVLAESQARWH